MTATTAWDGITPTDAATPADAATAVAATQLEAAANAAAAFGAAADEIDEAAAGVLGVNRTDLRILGLVAAAGTMTAGTLAGAARLSPAATTAAIQRLAAAGHLSRDVDPRDRRRAVVALTPDTGAMLDRLYGPVGEAGNRVLRRYDRTELRLITEFLEAGRRVQLEQAARIRATAAGIADFPDPRRQAKLGVLPQRPPRERS